MSLKPGAPLTIFRSRVPVVFRYAHIGEHLEDALTQWFVSDPDGFTVAMEDFEPPWLIGALRLLPGFLTAASFFSFSCAFFQHPASEVRAGALEAAHAFTDAHRDESCFGDLLELVDRVLDGESDPMCLHWVQCILANLGDGATR